MALGPMQTTKTAITGGNGVLRQNCVEASFNVRGAEEVSGNRLVMNPTGLRLECGRLVQSAAAAVVVAFQSRGITFDGLRTATP